MSLRKSPALTPAFLAACRSNARRSGGPRRVRAKARVALNNLKHGGRSKCLVQKLFEAGRDDECRLYAGLWGALWETYQPETPLERKKIERLARWA